MLKLRVTYCLLMLVAISARAQQKYTPANIHSHNDYSRPNAFYQAFKAGAGAIEADVHLRNGKLLVAHDTLISENPQSFTEIYLKPILKELQAHPRPLNLVIDLKGPYAPILAKLQEELKPLKKLINNNNGKPLSIIITGNRPQPALYKTYPSYITFDDDLQLPHTAEEWKRVAQISLNFENYSGWKGEGELPLIEERRLKSVINAVHAAGKKIRFWAAPDDPAGWQKILELHADILSTNKIDEVAAFLKSRP